MTKIGLIETYMISVKFFANRNTNLIFEFTCYTNPALYPIKQERDYLIHKITVIHWSQFSEFIVPKHMSFSPFTPKF